MNRLVANVDRVFISIDFITRQRFHYQQYKQWLVLCVDIYFIPILFGNTKNSDTRRHEIILRLMRTSHCENYISIFPGCNTTHLIWNLKYVCQIFLFGAEVLVYSTLKVTKGKQSPLTQNTNKMSFRVKRYNTNIFCNSQFVGLDHIILIM